MFSGAKVGRERTKKMRAVMKRMFSARCADEETGRTREPE